MPRSHKRRNTSKSGGSARSTKTRAASAAARNSSPTSIPSSALVLDGNPPNPINANYRRLRANAESRLATLLTEAMPANGLLRARHKQRIARERRLIAQLTELLD